MQYRNFPRDLKDHITFLLLCDKDGAVKNESVIKAFAVARKLDLFIEEHFLSHYPLASVTASAATLHVTIGLVEVWNSQDCNDDELTFEYCLKEYREHVDSLYEIFAVERQPNLDTQQELDLRKLYAASLEAGDGDKGETPCRAAEIAGGETIESIIKQLDGHPELVKILARSEEA